MKDGIAIKPFKWADLTLIVRFQFCSKCKLFNECYEIRRLAKEYESPCVVIGKANYSSNKCGENCK